MENKTEIIPKVPEPFGEATLTFPDGRVIQLPVLMSNDGQRFIDIRQLKEKCNCYSYDPGYTCTGACISQITSIEGLKGKLTHRGYAIKDLAENCTYLEVCYLLLYGELPTTNEKNKFEEQVVAEMCIHENMIRFYNSFEKDSHPMAIMVGMVGALSAFMKGTKYIKDSRERQITAIKIISKLPMIAALAFRTSRGLPIVYPKKKYGFIENFLRMMFKNTSTDWICDKKIVKVIEKIFILHADHEQNASTSTVRIATSSFANPYACISSGIASLWGPAHGGANEAVINMLEEIGTKENVPDFVDKVKRKVEGVRLMGFGHRVYKNFDPRALLMKELANEIASVIGTAKEKKMFEVALELERMALSDEYFIKRKLYPNVDFYTGIIYSSLGIPKNMFTVMFAVSRSVGWVSQMLEFTSENIRITRPRQMYVGKKEREFVKIENREETDDIVEIPKQSGIFKLPIL